MEGVLTCDSEEVRMIGSQTPVLTAAIHLTVGGYTSLTYFLAQGGQFRRKDNRHQLVPANSADFRLAQTILQIVGGRQVPLADEEVTIRVFIKMTGDGVWRIKRA